MPKNSETLGVSIERLIYDFGWQCKSAIGVALVYLARLAYLDSIRRQVKKEIEPEFEPAWGEHAATRESN